MAALQVEQSWSWNARECCCELLAVLTCCCCKSGQTSETDYKRLMKEMELYGTRAPGHGPLLLLGALARRVAWVTERRHGRKRI
jgi:hypothetical protein